jgi:phenylalanyl-tRNA synthetase beta chain
VVVDEAVTHTQLDAAIRQAGGGLVEEVTLFDVYRGKPIPEGRKSHAYAICYRAADRTLTDADAIGAHERIVAALKQGLQAELRA